VKIQKESATEMARDFLYGRKSSHFQGRPTGSIAGAVPKKGVLRQGTGNGASSRGACGLR